MTSPVPVSGAGRVELVGIHHSYDESGDPGSEVLTDVSLDITAGRSLALLGPSGCGKTTLLRSIAGLERPRAGTVSIDDVCVSGGTNWVPTERRRVGMVFQDWALFPHLSVAKNVAYGIGRQDREARVAESLHLVGLDGLGERMPATLSGGQQQRVALARALAPRPKVLLLDEPFSNLDTNLRSSVRSEVRDLLLTVGITAVFVTHDQEEAFILGDDVAVMNEGRIVQIGTPQQLYARPATRWVAEFIGEASLVAAEARGRSASTALGDLPLEDDATGEVDVVLRPEELAIVEGDMAMVQLVEFYGHDAMVHVDVGGQNVRVRTVPQPKVKRGDRVGLTFLGREVRSFPRTEAGSA